MSLDDLKYAIWDSQNILFLCDDNFYISLHASRYDGEKRIHAQVSVKESWLETKPVLSTYQNRVSSVNHYGSPVKASLRFPESNSIEEVEQVLEDLKPLLSVACGGDPSSVVKKALRKATLFFNDMLVYKNEKFYTTQHVDCDLCGSSPVALEVTVYMHRGRIIQIEATHDYGCRYGDSVELITPTPEEMNTLREDAIGWVTSLDFMPASDVEDWLDTLVK